MTLGQKLAAYRKLSGITQQQLGERLNISAQAISKWEKDMSEPALATLRSLAEFYNVSVDELLDLESGFSDFVTNVNEEKGEEKSEEQKENEEIVGFCKICGITVKRENLGAKSPMVLCNTCHEMEETRKKLIEETTRRKREIEQLQAENELKRKRKKARIHRALGMAVACIAATLFLILMIVNMASSFGFGKLFFTFVGTYAVFAFVDCLFYECFVTDVIGDWFCKTIQFPGLIFTFDIDGILWLIGMKILFWFLGALFAVVVGAIGIIIGFVCAPFVFPYVTVREHRKIINGTFDSE